MTRGRLRGWSVIGLVMGVVIGGPVAIATEELPRPPGVHDDGSPEVSLMLGALPVESKAFTSDLPLGEVKAFYMSVLPKQGWKIGLLPAMKQALEQQGMAQRALEEHRKDIEEDASLRSLVSHFNPAAMDQAMERLLYAQRGKERVLVYFSSDAPHETIVFLNRWQEPQDAHAPRADSNSAVLGGPCCNSDAVPPARRKLPQSVPVYPNARVVTSGEMPQLMPSQQTASEMSVTVDALDQVTAFYTQRMTAQGWSLEDLSSQARQAGAGMPLPGGVMFGMKLLAFRKGEAICMVAVSQAPPGMSSNQTPAAAAPRPSAPPERTMILVNYMTMPSLNPRRNPFHGQPLAPASR